MEKFRGVPNAEQLLRWQSILDLADDQPYAIHLTPAPLSTYPATSLYPPAPQPSAQPCDDDYVMWNGEPSPRLVDEVPAVANDVAKAPIPTPKLAEPAHPAASSEEAKKTEDITKKSSIIVVRSSIPVEVRGKHCGQCGATVRGPFCSQCGNKTTAI